LPKINAQNGLRLKCPAPSWPRDVDQYTVTANAWDLAGQ
jgi:hypothetical protein